MCQIHLILYIINKKKQLQKKKVGRTETNPTKLSKTTGRQDYI